MTIDWNKKILIKILRLRFREYLTITYGIWMDDLR
jgi:hypothetical protein